MQKSLLNKSTLLNDLNSKKELLKERNKYDKESSEVKKELTILEEQKLSITSSLSKTNLELEEIKRVLTNNTNKLNDLNKDYKITENNINKLNTELNMLIKRKFELNNKKIY